MQMNVIIPIWRYCLFLFVIPTVLLSAGCDSETEPRESPEGYNLDEPYTIKLPLELDEISGVAYYPVDSSIFAINDERGWLYKIYPARPTQIEKWKFFDGADFEDLVLLDSTFYVLESNGNIIAFRHSSSDSVIAKRNLFPEQGNEFEILFYDPQIKKMVLICKDCESDKKKFLSVYTFDPYTGTYANHDLKIDVQRISAVLKKKSIKFKPSAAAINPVTGDIYIVSAINKLLVITDREGSAKKVFNIDPGKFKQPEGITFTPWGNMIISNEAADIGVANIMIFKYHQTKTTAK
jgi:hypothetical protein